VVISVILKPMHATCKHEDKNPQQPHPNTGSSILKTRNRRTTTKIYPIAKEDMSIGYMEVAR
jgi:hypothetical protein